MDLQSFTRVLKGYWIALAVAGSIAVPPILEIGPVLRAQTGGIVGGVVLSPGIASRRPRFRLYSEYGPGSTPGAAPRINEMENVVIYLDSADGLDGTSQAGAKLEVRQTKEMFSPHVLPVVIGATVEFPNADPFFHNVFSLSKSKTFDLGRYPEGSTKRVQFDRLGVVQVFCHIHSDMSAVVFVTPNGFFATPDSSGAYSIRDIPAGTYRLIAWHERAKPIVTTVRVEAGRMARIEFNIPIADVEPARR